MKKKNLAFTLAEVLIVIGIIGVVAALTLPNLNHATGDKERITRVKKAYANLSEAFDRAQAIYGKFSYNSWFNDISAPPLRVEKFANRITEFIKISKKCGRETNKGCFSEGNVYTINGSELSSMDASSMIYKVITPDGMSLGFDEYSTRFGANQLIYVDIDGPNKGSNTYGKDIFRFDIDEDTNLLYPYKDVENADSYIFDGKNAAAWIIENDNADYLKADSTGKCNDSDIVLDWTTNTSCH